MQRLKALLESSCRYVFDFKRNKDFHRLLDDQQIPTFAFHFAKWKRPLLNQWFPERRFRYYPLNMTGFEQRRLLKFIQSLPGAEVMIWGRNHLDLLNYLPNKIWYLEDGFIRSIQLGASHTPPISLAIDSRTPYFDSSKPSDLEILFNGYQFEDNQQLMQNASILMEKMLKLGISKYNHIPGVIRNSIYGEKTRKRVLVIGQVESDASIKYGCERPINNNDLIQIASKENPGAQIIYKPHPDVIHGHRKIISDPQKVNNLCQILEQDIPIALAFETIDHVYTITSLAGFEAVIRDIEVTTIGAPFYAGWGLTDDRQPIPRRSRRLTKEQLFAGALILYPKYFNYKTGVEIELNAALDMIEQQKREYAASLLN